MIVCVCFGIYGKIESIHYNIVGSNLAAFVIDKSLSFAEKCDLGFSCRMITANMHHSNDVHSATRTGRFGDIPNEIDQLRVRAKEAKAT